ncbi:MAG: alpha/beta hydrolase [Candidatus Sericytochromatia bacterium]
MASIRKVKLNSQRLQIDPGRLAHGRHERLGSPSRHLGNQRLLDIYLPPGYDIDVFRRYPVLYMHDGNNLFFPELAFGGMPWHVDRTLDRLIALKLVQPMIVVGIHNTMGRNSEYTWSQMRTRWGREGGQGPRYAAYLTEEVKPLIDRRYRTLADPWHTGVMGSSLGGLISLYMGLHYPHVFGQIGMVSPSLWWNHREALRHAHGFMPGQNLWLDMGTREGHSRQRVDYNPNIHNTRALKQILQRRGYIEGHNLGYLEDRGALHNEWWWGQRLHLPLMFFWGTEKGRKLIVK